MSILHATFSVAVERHIWLISTILRWGGVSVLYSCKGSLFVVAYTYKLCDESKTNAIYDRGTHSSTKNKNRR